MSGIEQRLVAIHRTIGRWILNDQPKDIRPIVDGAGLVEHHNLDAHRFGTRLDDLDVLRMAERRDQETVLLSFAATMSQRHCFGTRRRLVQQRSVGDFQSTQFCNHRLEVEQHLKSTLRNFRLIRSVGGVPGWIFQYVSLQHFGSVSAVVALADTILQYDILVRVGLQFSQGVFFTQPGRNIHPSIFLNRFRDHGVGQFVQRRVTKDRQHLLDFVFTWANVTSNERGKCARHRILSGCFFRYQKNGFDQTESTSQHLDVQRSHTTIRSAC